MVKLKCLVVDDETIALDILEEYIANVQQLELVAKCHDPMEAFNYLHNQTIDLIFLDIQMPGLSGTSFARTFSEGPKIIFTTAFSSYAVEGFELNAIDYLLKPFSFDRFLKAVNKVLSIYKLEQTPVAAAPQEDEGFIYIKSEGMMTKIFHHDILFIESLRNSIQVFTNEKVHVSYMTISAMEERLPAALFYRIHRSYIVPLQKIEAYSQNVVRIGDKQIPIGRDKKEEFIHLMK